MKKFLTAFLASLMTVGVVTAFAEAPHLASVPSEPVEVTDEYRIYEFMQDGDQAGQNTVRPFETYADQQDLFTEYTYANENTVDGDLTYFVYEPTEHGFDPDGQYPVSIWFHGAGNQKAGRNAITLCGASGMASDEYQASLGGMYIIVPLSPDAGWGYGAVDAVNAMLKNVKENGHCSDELIVCGTSAGGLMVNRWLEHYGYKTDIVFWMSTRLPEVKSMKVYNSLGLKMWYVITEHDGPFDAAVPAATDGTYAEFENLEINVLDWVRYGNGLIAVLNDKDETNGQHCICVQVNRNLIRDDGTPDLENRPDGVTGWLSDKLAEVRNEK